MFQVRTNEVLTKKGSGILMQTLEIRKWGLKNEAKVGKCA
jgi:hypothetical protein